MKFKDVPLSRWITDGSGQYWYKLQDVLSGPLDGLRKNDEQVKVYNAIDQLGFPCCIPPEQEYELGEPSDEVKKRLRADR